MQPSQLLKWALRVGVASTGASLACSGSLGVLGSDDAGSNTPGSSAAASNASGGARTSSGASSSVASASSSAGSNADGGSSASTATASQSTDPSDASNSSGPSSSSTSSSSAVDASAGSDAQADAGPLSFAADVYPIIAARCLACHTPLGMGFTDGRLDMTTGGAAGAYAQLVNVRAMGDVPGTAGVTCANSGLVRVVPGSALTSLLYQKVNSKLMTGGVAPCGNPMPQPDAAPALTMDQVVTIQTWIDEGAKP